jgi:PilZ domain-containing protein
VEQLSDPLLDTGLDELRQSTRFRKEPGTDSAVIWLKSGQEQLVDVYDESLGGLCLVIPGAAGFNLGSIATIVYHADVLEGTVRNIRPQADGTFLVGFQCRLWRAG